MRLACKVVALFQFCCEFVNVFLQVYKLSEFESAVSVAAAVCRTLVELTYIYPKTGDAFFTRYKGRHLIVSKVGF